MKLITTYLEMTNPTAFRSGFIVDPDVQIIQSRYPLVSFYRFLYGAVGEQWMWRDRLAWSDEQLLAWLSLPNVSLYVLYVQGTPAGYIELDYQPEATQIDYFGLFPAFFGKGYGKHLLSFGIQQAWQDRDNQGRVWVHTCNLDGPHALANYQNRGFTIYDVRESVYQQSES